MIAQPNTPPDDEQKQVAWGDLDFAWLPADLIQVEQAYQRALDLRRVERMAEAFNPMAYGALTVAKRDGSYFIIDGQHRLVLACQLFGTDVVVPCMVSESAGRKVEAGSFHTINSERHALRSIERFKALLEADNETAWAILFIVEGAGLRIDARGCWDRYKGESGGIVAIDALTKIYGADPTLLREVLEILAGAFEHDYAAYTGLFMHGLTTFVRHYRHRYDRLRLMRVLRERGHSTVTAKSERLREAIISTRRLAIARVLADMYNHGLKPDKLLPAFDSQSYTSTVNQSNSQARFTVEEA